MRWALCLWVGMLASFGAQAQSAVTGAQAQEDFALAVAKAHARTSLFGAGSGPVAIHASVKSRLALHATGQGTYDNEWVDNQHWRRVIRFPDYEQSEMRNDSGHSWTDQPGGQTPVRIAQMLRVVVFHAPSSTAASQLPVSETSTTGDGGEPLTCFSATSPATINGFQGHFGWCFEKGSGVLVSQDLPLNTHVVYSDYVDFQRKREFTHVRVTSGGLEVLGIDLRYAALDPHALDGATPSAFMQRSKSAGTSPNPEELRKGTVEYENNPPLPPGSSATDAKKPVELLFHVSAENAVLDASVEDAPTEGMAQAALDAAQKFTFTPLLVDGKAVANHFYYSVWFRGAKDAAMAGTTGAAAAGSAPAGTPLSGGVFRSEEPPFTFQYPAEFTEIPRGELEERLRSSSGPHSYGLEHGSSCNTLLFRAQRLRPGESRPEVVSINDLSPNCIFGSLDHAALENTAVGMARSLVAQWAEGEVSKPRSYAVNGHVFATVSARGTGHATVPEQTNALMIVTEVHGHIVGWTIFGPLDDLAATMRACMLQLGTRAGGPLLPPN